MSLYQSQATEAINAARAAVTNATATLQTAITNAIQALVIADPIPTPPPTPTPDPTPPPTGGLGYSAVIRDDFSGYTDTADFINHTPKYTKQSTNIGGSPTMVIASSSGTKYLRYIQPINTKETPQIEIDFSGYGITSLDNMWFRTRIMFEPGWTTDGWAHDSDFNPALSTDFQSAGYKVMGGGWTPGFDGRWTFDLTNSTQYQQSWDVRGSTSHVEDGPFTWAVVGSVTSEWTSGAIWEFVQHFQKLDASHASHTMYMGPVGSVTKRNTIIGVRTSGQPDVPTINRVHAGQNFNRIRKQNQALRYYLIEVVNGASYSNPWGLQL